MTTFHGQMLGIPPELLSKSASLHLMRLSKYLSLVFIAFNKVLLKLNHGQIFRKEMPPDEHVYSDHIIFLHRNYCWVHY
ncbi:hypothetical protein JTE90_013582 [Oedothorax gibbosus]|uniref:Uncharacterized protein n=1 Tax=Oedothorax gibbosus TaxID=931172 RepID=A0AAV6VE76_9ARAC|nr:hypothetical protein JTE90_013582 [Oedothorax gibbosus]